MTALLSGEFLVALFMAGLGILTIKFWNKINSQDEDTEIADDEEE